MVFVMLLAAARVGQHEESEPITSYAIHLVISCGIVTSKVADTHLK
jgi:hypothetical protein